MSQVYSTEPATSGRVTLETTAGPIDIQLWCKECPITTQLFLQLCLDGYYNNMVFHRIMDNFLIQTGHERKGQQNDINDNNNNYNNSSKRMEYFQKMNTSNNNNGSKSGEEDPFHDRMRKRKLELNPRIRFNHRGQLAMALPVEDGDNDGDNPLTGQFFITLDEAPFLNQKHIIFGTVSGPTMFNAIRIGRTEVTEDEDHRPVDMEMSPPTILSTVIHHYKHTNPSTLSITTPPDLLYWKNNNNNNNKTKSSAKDEMKARKKKRKGKRDLNVLSFGNEMEEDIEEVSHNSTSLGIQSSHDVLATEDQNSFLQKQSDQHLLSKIKENKKTLNAKTLTETTKDAKSNEGAIHTNNLTMNTINNSPQNDSENHYNNDKPGMFENRKELESQQKIVRNAQKEKMQFDEETKNLSNDAMALTSSKERKNVAKKKKSELEIRREKYLKRSQSRNRVKKEQREKDILANLQLFRSKIKRKSTEADNHDATDDNKQTKIDNSLASRMAKRLEKSKSEDKKGLEEKGVVYHGQVLEHDDYQDEQQHIVWYETNFKCKKHTDHSSKNADISFGGDGRNIDDYVVLDNKKQRYQGRSSNHQFNHRRRR